MTLWKNTIIQRRHCMLYLVNTAYPQWNKALPRPRWQWTSGGQPYLSIRPKGIGDSYPLLCRGFYVNKCPVKMVWKELEVQTPPRTLVTLKRPEWACSPSISTRCKLSIHLGSQDPYYCMSLRVFSCSSIFLSRNNHTYGNACGDVLLKVIYVRKDLQLLSNIWKN